MDRPASPHPSDLSLADYRAGRLDPAQEKEVERHIAACPTCLERARAVRPAQATLRNEPPESDSEFGLDSLATRAGAEDSSPTPTPTPTLSDPHLPPELARHPHYTDIRKLGSGGMGVVYRAHNTLMGRTEVFKVVGRHLLEHTGVLERFLREIRSAARLNHPNIVTAYSASQIGDSLVLTMEYVDGMDLARLVKSKGPLPVRHACYFVYQAALGLQHAFERDTVHRDIKPANLMLARDGKRSVIKILDFGLAKASREGPREDDLTGAGQSLGTPSFMAPEQIQDAREADIRADIYSLGCTLYHLLTGAPPFQGKSLFDLYRAHHESRPERLDRVRKDVPAALAEVVDRMLAKDPSDRYQTPQEVAWALSPFFKDPGASPGNLSGSKPAASLHELPTELEPPPPHPSPVRDSSWASLVELQRTEREEAFLPARPPARESTRPAPRVPPAAGSPPRPAPESRPVTIPPTPEEEPRSRARRRGLLVPAVLLLGLAAGAGVWWSGLLPKATRLEEGTGELPASQTTVPAASSGVGSAPSASSGTASGPASPVLFNGKNLEGWVAFSNGYQVAPDEVATVDQGEIVLSPRISQGGLRSTRKFQDFWLSFEYLFPADGTLSVPGSGVAILPDSGEGLGFARGVECQVRPGETGDVYGFPPDPFLVDAERRDGGIQLVRRSLLKERPVGQWNAMRIHFQRRRILIELNGEEVNRVDCSADVAGWVCLMSQGSDVRYRNLVVEETRPNTTEPTTDGRDFVPLFNGKDLKGWRTDDSQPGNWRVEDGVLVGSGSELSHLYTERDDYRDFHFRAEVRVNEGGNSGVMFRASSSPALPEDRPKYPGGYEAQIYPGTDGNSLTGCLFGDLKLLAPQSEASYPADRWTTIEVIANAGHIVVKVDGTTTAEDEDAAGFDRAGCIALQQMAVGTVVEFRKIEIRER
ncbi:MAG: family 16 glycoside hydrolase [Isosphaeraceae bacterium]